MHDFSEIKVMFFDFDNTLACHDLSVLGKDELYLAWKNPNCVYDGRIKKNLGIEKFIKQFTSVSKYVLTLTGNSLLLDAKRRWVEREFPRQFDGVIGTVLAEEKIEVMQKYVDAFDLRSDEVLLIDDLWETVRSARNKGFKAIMPQEIMNAVIAGNDLVHI